MVLDGGISYSDACIMDYEEIQEANAALDIYIEQTKRKNSRK